jgi:hypothetical protein
MANETLQQESTLYKVWSTDSGIFVFRWTEGAVIDMAIAKETAERVAQLAIGRAHCILINLEGVKSIDRDARGYYAHNQGPRAVAMVGASPVARVIGNIFLGLNRHGTLPLRMFSNEEDAVLWLKTFIE